MKLKILIVIGLNLIVNQLVVGQSTRQQVLNAYYTALTEQYQINTEISAGLQRISPRLEQDYQKLITLTDQDATLPWAYFIKKLERTKGGEALTALCREGQKNNQLVRRFHNLRLVDPYSQQTIDTAQSIRRLSFFGVMEGDKVAEIGFGYGYNLHLLGLAYEQIEIFANELDAYRLKRMAQNIRDEYPADRSANYHFIAGAVHSTNLEGRELDLIILENVLHHIADPEVFFRSMVESLEVGGEIVIIEAFAGSDRAGNFCPDLQPRAELEDLFAKAGFYIKKERALEGDYETMLRLSRKSGAEAYSN